MVLPNLLLTFWARENCSGVNGCMKTLTSENAFGGRAPLRVRWMHENKQKCDSTEVLLGAVSD